MSLSFKFISLKTKTQYGKPLTITLRYKQSAGVCDMRDEKKNNKPYLSDVSEQYVLC